jgi:hypothetical protein
VGWTTNSIILGKHSGRAAFRDRLRTLGYTVGDNQLNDAFKRFKDLADRKKVVYDEDIAALVDDEVGRSHGRISLAGLNVSTGMGSKPMATVSLDVDGERRDGMAIGDGAVDATFNAIRQAWPHEISLKLYAVQSITGGTDAQARVTVRFEEAASWWMARAPTPARWSPRRAPMCTRSTSCWSSASGRSRRPCWASRRPERGYDPLRSSPLPVLSRSSSILIEASALVRPSSKASPDSFAQGLEIGGLGAGHRLVAGGPVLRVLDRVGAGLRVGLGVVRLGGGLLGHRGSPLMEQRGNIAGLPQPSRQGCCCHRAW